MRLSIGDEIEEVDWLWSAALRAASGLFSSKKASLALLQPSSSRGTWSVVRGIVISHAARDNEHALLF